MDSNKQIILNNLSKNNPVSAKPTVSIGSRFKRFLKSRYSGLYIPTAKNGVTSNKNIMFSQKLISVIIIPIMAIPVEILKSNNQLFLLSNNCLKNKKIGKADKAIKISM